MLEGNRFEPVYADVYAVAVVAPRDLEVLAARRPGSNKDRVELAAVEQFLHALDSMVQLQVDAHVDDAVDFLVENLGRQTETRDVGAHQAARRIECFEDRNLVAERPKIVRDGQRRTAAAKKRHLLAVAFRRPFRQALRDVLAVIGRDPFQPANCHGLLVDTSAAARRFARPVADAAEYPREHVRLAILDVGVAKTPLRNEPYI